MLFTSSMQGSGEENFLQAPTLATMPTELLENICQFLSQRVLLSLMLCNSNFREVAVQYLYMAPEFTSTYRFAQFTFIVVNRPHYARRVRSLDLSKFCNARDKRDPTQLAEMAGWREFKYRQQQIFAVPRHASHVRSYSTSPTYRSLDEQRALGLPFSSFSKTHPAPSPMLSSFHRTRDVPIGGIYHVLEACTRIKHLNMSRLHLASDFIIVSPIHPHPTQTYLRSRNFYADKPEQSKATITFVSDVPKTWTWQESEPVPVYADALLELICQLRELETFTARHVVWLNTNRVRQLMREAQREESSVRGLKLVDFLYSGMQKGKPWAISGTREQVEGLVGGIGNASWERTIS